jgi:hypothetical protein
MASPSVLVIGKGTKMNDGVIEREGEGIGPKGPGAAGMISPAMASAAAMQAAAMQAAAYARPAFDKFQYLVQDYPSNMDGSKIQNKLNELGSTGWQLIAVGQTDDGMRAWFIKGGAASPPVPEIEETSS